jgi:hypothetical protein
MAQKKKYGSLVIPEGLYPEPHELEAATFFIKLGKNVTFLVPSRNRNSRTPDVIIDDIRWEIKSPIGKSKTTISNALKRAVRQSPYIIIDARYTKLSDAYIKTEIRRNLLLTRSIARILLITKKQEVVEIER